MNGDEACKFALWWSHKRKRFTTARQAAIAAWEEASRTSAPTRSKALADAGFTRRPSLRAMEMRETLELIAAPMRPDGTWNRDREACRELAAEALGRYDDDPMPHGHRDVTDDDPGPRPLLCAMTVRNACQRGYNGCGFDATAQVCVAAECPKTPNV